MKKAKIYIPNKSPMQSGLGKLDKWIIEFKKQPDDSATFNKLLDAFLQESNSDYEAKRYNNTTLKPPKIHSARKDLFKDMPTVLGSAKNSLLLLP